MEKMNIYVDETGEYYYGSKKRKGADKLKDRKVNVDYAFAFCSNKNFSSEMPLPQKEQRIISEKCVNKTWRQEHNAMVECGA